MPKKLKLVSALVLGILGVACGPGDEIVENREAVSAAEGGLALYTTVRLTTDVSVLSEAEKAMIPLLMEAADAMTDAFWMESYGERDIFLASLAGPAEVAYGTINFGPWDRIDGNVPWLAGVGEKPAGANFYPADMTVEEFETAIAAAPDGGEALTSLYTIVRRNDAGELQAIPYSEFFSDAHGRAAERLRAAATLA